MELSENGKLYATLQATLATYNDPTTETNACIDAGLLTKDGFDLTPKGEDAKAEYIAAVNEALKNLGCVKVR